MLRALGSYLLDTGDRPRRAFMSWAGSHQCLPKIFSVQGLPNGHGHPQPFQLWIPAAAFLVNSALIPTFWPKPGMMRSVMITEEDYEAALDTSPEMAFVRLERKYRAAYEANLENSQGESLKQYTIEYMNHVVAAANPLGLDLFPFWSPPSESDNDLWEIYNNLRSQVDQFAVQVQITHIRSSLTNSVALDPSEKKHLRAYAEKIKDIIERSSLSAAKKERLFNKLNAFIAEVDRDRTPLQKFTDIVMALSATGAAAADELEPAWKWVKLGAAILGVRQETEQARLPAPRKKIEGPKHKLPPPRKSNEDEIRIEFV